MSVKYKVLKDFQLITEDKKIIIIKAKTIIENYTFKNKNEIVKVPVEVIKNNEDYFAQFDWKEELQTFLRTNKIPQPAVITKKIVPFIESLMEESGTTIKEVFVEKEVIKEIIVEKPTFVEKEVIKEVIVEKPKIVEKEVIVEKPTLVEKEVVIEKLVTDNSASIELENKLNKLQLKESQLDREIEANNQKELSLENLEKKLNKLSESLESKSQELDLKESELLTKEQTLNVKESNLNEKENNLSDYISLTKLNQSVQSLKSQGKVMDLYESLIRSIL